MPHTTTKRKRTKRPDSRPNGKRRLKAQQAAAEKDRLARVAANERKGKLFAPLHHEKLPPLPTSNDEDGGAAAVKNKRRGQQLRKAKNNDPSHSVRFRSLHKLLRQIVALDENQNSGVILNEAQKVKLGRYDEVVQELEEMQRSLDEEKEEEDGNESESSEGGGSSSESEGEEDDEKGKR